MGRNLDRDYGEMIKYEKTVMDRVSEVVMLLRRTEGVLDAYASELDRNTQDKIDELHDVCNQYIDALGKYEELAEHIGKKGKELKNVVENGIR